MIPNPFATTGFYRRRPGLIVLLVVVQGVGVAASTSLLALTQATLVPPAALARARPLGRQVWRRSVDDGRGVVEVTPNLDRVYLERWVDDLALRTLWQRVLGRRALDKLLTLADARARAAPSQ